MKKILIFISVMVMAFSPTLAHWFCYSDDKLVFFKSLEHSLGLSSLLVTSALGIYVVVIASKMQKKLSCETKQIEIIDKMLDAYIALLKDFYSESEIYFSFAENVLKNPEDLECGGRRNINRSLSDQVQQPRLKLKEISSQITLINEILKKATVLKDVNMDIPKEHKNKLRLLLGEPIKDAEKVDGIKLEVFGVFFDAKKEAYRMKMDIYVFRN